MDYSAREATLRTTPNTIKRGIAIGTILLMVQVLFSTPRASANIISDAYGSYSVGLASAVGYKLCLHPCGFAAVTAVIAVNTFGPVLAQEAVEYVKPGLLQMITNWGATFFRP